MVVQGTLSIGNNPYCQVSERMEKTKAHLTNEAVPHCQMCIVHMSMPQLPTGFAETPQRELQKVLTTIQASGSNKHQRCNQITRIRQHMQLVSKISVRIYFTGHGVKKTKRPICSRERLERTGYSEHGTHPALGLWLCLGSRGSRCGRPV